MADAWWALAESRKGEERDAILLYAGEWYGRPLNTLQAGPTKLKIETRLEVLVAVRERHHLAQSKRTQKVPGTSGSLWSDAAP